MIITQWTTLSRLHCQCESRLNRLICDVYIYSCLSHPHLVSVYLVNAEVDFWECTSLSSTISDNKHSNVIIVSAVTITIGLEVIHYKYDPT